MTAEAVAEARPPAAGLRRAAGALPLLVVAALLLGTGADIFPDDAIVAAGPVELDLSRLLIIAGFSALLATEGVRLELFRSRLGIPLAILLLVGLVATVRWDTEARYRFLVEGIALFYLTFAVVRARPQARGALLIVAVVALAIPALTGLAQVSQAEATGFYRQGCVPVTQPPPEVPPDSLTRATGTFANPNVLAGHLLLLAPLGALALAFVSPLLELRLAVALAVGLGYLAILFTFSRAAVLVALFAVGVGLAASRLRYRRYLAAVAAALAVAAFSLFASCGSEATASYGRMQEWRDTISVIRDNPLTGVGLGRLGDVLTARNQLSTARHAHNLWLTWGAEAGLAALGAWIWLFAALLWRSFRSARAGESVARAALVALAGFAGFSLADHPANVDRVAVAFWIVAGLAAASSGVREAATPSPSSEGPG